MGVGLLTPIRQRRKPEESVLYRVLAGHLDTFLDRIEHDDTRAGLPFFVRRELRAFLECGILARGFLRVHCTACGKDDLLAQSRTHLALDPTPTLVPWSACRAGCLSAEAHDVFVRDSLPTSKNR